MGKWTVSVGYTLNQSIEKGYVDNMSDGGYPSKPSKSILEEKRYI